MFQYGHDPLAEQVNGRTMRVLVLVKKLNQTESVFAYKKCYVGAGLQPSRQMNYKWA